MKGNKNKSLQSHYYGRVKLGFDYYEVSGKSHYSEMLHGEKIGSSNSFIFSSISPVE